MQVFISASFMTEEGSLMVAPHVERLGYDGTSFGDHGFVCVGSQREEFDALGFKFENRGARANEMMSVHRASVERLAPLLELGMSSARLTPWPGYGADAMPVELKLELVEEHAESVLKPIRALAA